MTLLLTGFAPFGGETLNPSWKPCAGWMASASRSAVVAAHASNRIRHRAPGAG